jgi:hypothetical protein
MGCLRDDGRRDALIWREQAAGRPPQRAREGGWFQLRSCLARGLPF